VKLNKADVRSLK